MLIVVQAVEGGLEFIRGGLKMNKKQIERINKLTDDLMLAMSWRNTPHFF